MPLWNTYHLAASVADALQALANAPGPARIIGAGQIGGPQVRNTATLGGNVAHALPAADARGRRVIPLLELYRCPGQSALEPAGELDVLTDAWQSANEPQMKDAAPLTLGVIADTHVPDRARQLNPRIAEIFRAAHVNAILHAGDISTPIVIETLARLAPVHAVRGNRDWWRLRHLPALQSLTFGGVEIGLLHGHGRWWEYLGDKPIYWLRGYELKRFYPRMAQAFPRARALVFGHIHRPVNEWVNGQLVFNPGSACCPEGPDAPPSVGLLHLGPGQIWGEIVIL